MELYYVIFLRCQSSCPRVFGQHQTGGGLCIKCLSVSNSFAFNLIIALIILHSWFSNHLYHPIFCAYRSPTDLTSNHGLPRKAKIHTSQQNVRRTGCRQRRRRRSFHLNRKWHKQTQNPDLSNPVGSSNWHVLLHSSHPRSLFH